MANLEVPISIEDNNTIDFNYDRIDPKKLSLKDFKLVADQFNNKIGKESLGPEILQNKKFTRMLDNLAGNETITNQEKKNNYENNIKKMYTHIDARQSESALSESFAKKSVEQLRTKLPDICTQLGIDQKNMQNDYKDLFEVAYQICQMIDPAQFGASFPNTTVNTELLSDLNDQRTAQLIGKAFAFQHCCKQYRDNTNTGLGTNMPDGIIGTNTWKMMNAVIDSFGQKNSEGKSKIDEFIEKEKEETMERKGPVIHTINGGPAGLTIESDFTIEYKKKGTKITSDPAFTKDIEYKQDSIKINNQPINTNEYKIKNFNATTGSFILEKKTDKGDASVNIQAPNVTVTTPGAKIEQREFTTTNMTAKEINTNKTPNTFTGTKTERTESPETVSLEMKAYKNKKGEVKQLLYSPSTLSEKARKALNNNNNTKNIVIIGPDNDIKVSLDEFPGNKPSTMLKIEEITTDTNGKVINFKPGVEGSGTTDIGPYLAFIPDSDQKAAMKTLYETSFQNKKMSFEIENGNIVGLDLNTLPADDSIFNAFANPKLKRLKVQNYAPTETVNITSIVEEGTKLNNKNITSANNGDLTYETKKGNPFVLKNGNVVRGKRKADGVQ